MKATISVNGFLTIIAETEIEAFALKSWWNKQKDCDYSVVLDLGNWDEQDSAI